MVEIEKLPDGGYRVSRVFATKAAMQAGASALERIVPEAYEPLPVPVSPIEPRLSGIRDTDPGIPPVAMRD